MGTDTTEVCWWVFSSTNPCVTKNVCITLWPSQIKSITSLSTMQPIKMPFWYSLVLPFPTHQLRWDFLQLSSDMALINPIAHWCFQIALSYRTSDHFNTQANVLSFARRISLSPRAGEDLILSWMKSCHWRYHLEFYNLDCPKSLLPIKRLLFNLQNCMWLKGQASKGVHILMLSVENLLS